MCHSFYVLDRGCCLSRSRRVSPALVRGVDTSLLLSDCHAPSCA